MKIGVICFLIFSSVCVCNRLSSKDLPAKNIEIIIPANGSSIESSRSKDGKNASFTVKGNSINLKAGEYITLLMKPKSEKIWQRISDSNKIIQNYVSSWSFDIDFEIGKKFKEAELMAVVSTSKIDEKELTKDQLNTSNILCQSQPDFVINIK